MTPVYARTTDVFGRFRVTAGGNDFLADTPVDRGGPGEALTASDLALSALAICALGNVQRFAAEFGIALENVGVTVDSVIDEDNPRRIARMPIDIEFIGVTADDAQRLVTAFTDSCPLYNTLAAATALPVSVRTA